MITKEQFNNLQPGDVIYNPWESFTILRKCETGYLVRDNKHPKVKNIFTEKDCESYTIKAKQERFTCFL